MQKSFIDKVFPKPQRSVLPQYDDRVIFEDEERSPTSHVIKLQRDVSTSRSSRRSSGSKTSLKAAPLTASVVHHDDPFLAVDRASQNLQTTIQSLLDFQSQHLSGRTSDNGDDTGSQKSQLPISSADTTSAYSQPVSGTIPIRQPPKKRTTLRGARRGLVKSMQEFAALKEEELRITEDECAHRKTALDRVIDLETRKEAVEHEIQSLKEQSSNNESHSLRSEAQAVRQEIHELEGRLMELRAKHRHLIIRAEQIENTTASELSSYEGTLVLMEKETKAFLKRPPVKQALVPRNAVQLETDMYLLTPDRRTLEMAKEQWTGELTLLETHKQDVERDRQALLQGAKMWKETLTKVDEFEQQLRFQVKASNRSPTNNDDPDPTRDIISSLNSTTSFLEQQLSKAESQNWNLLICAIGAELEAFRQARALLAPDESTLTPTQHPLNGIDQSDNNVRPVTRGSEDENSDVPHADLLGDGDQLRDRISAAMAGPLINTVHDDLEGSNESLKATLKSFPPPQQKMIPSPSASASAGMNANGAQRHGRTYSESEDDEPGPDFLISHQ